ncbi:MAG: YfhO family protein, partial [Oscillospiraceae bacterium]|nr:YfhO family protein [Oscillospiraceae bacterium]
MEKKKEKRKFFNIAVPRFIADNKYCYYSALIAGFIMIFVFFVYDMLPEPMGKGMTILRMDLYHQYGPLFAELYERIMQNKSLVYSWASGMGSSFLGNTLNYLSSPFAVIMLILGHRNMTEAIAGMILIKAAFSAGTFTWFIKKSLGRHDGSAAAFGLLYAFCGYFIAYYWNVMWLDAMYLYPVILYGIEKIINGKKATLYILSLALLMYATYYIGFMVCILSALYFLYYFFIKNKMSDKSRGFEDELSLSEAKSLPLGHNLLYNYRRLAGTKFFKAGVKFAVSSITAIMLAAAALLPLFFILRATSATNPDNNPFPEDYKSYYNVFHFLANHLAGADPTIRSSGENVLPNVYCGIITVMLVPLYLFSKKITSREKTLSVMFLTLFYFSFNLNKLNYIWHAFHFPNDLPYRFSFAYSFFILILAYKAFTRLYEFTPGQILGVGVGVMGFAVLVQEMGSKNVTDTVFWTTIVFVAVYVFVFWLIKNPVYNAKAMISLLVCCCATEVIVASTPNYEMNQAKVHFVEDLSDFQEVMAELGQIEDENGFYRMELSNWRTHMDPSWYFYNGISVFSSMAYQSLSHMQRLMGMDGNDINSYNYSPQTPVYNAMTALKYVAD